MMPNEHITPEKMIEWLNRCIKQREDAIRSTNAARMEKSIRDFIAAHTAAPVGVGLDVWSVCAMKDDGRSDNSRSWSINDVWWRVVVENVRLVDAELIVKTHNDYEAQSAEIARLREALGNAQEAIECWGAQVHKDSSQKEQYKADLDAIDKALATDAKGGA